MLLVDQHVLYDIGSQCPGIHSANALYFYMDRFLMILFT